MLKEAETKQIGFQVSEEVDVIGRNYRDTAPNHFIFDLVKLYTAPNETCMSERDPTINSQFLECNFELPKVSSVENFRISTTVFPKTVWFGELRFPKLPQNNKTPKSETSASFCTKNHQNPCSIKKVRSIFVSIGAIFTWSRVNAPYIGLSR